MSIKSPALLDTRDRPTRRPWRDCRHLLTACAVGLLLVATTTAQTQLSIPVNADGDLQPPPGTDLQQTVLLETVAGTGEYSYGGDGGPATEAQLAGPSGIALDTAGSVYVADAWNERIRKIDASTGVIETVAGAGGNSYGGDGGPATEAGLGQPSAVAVDAAGNVYVAGAGNRIRKVDASTGVIETVAGTGEYSYGGDGGPATEAGLAQPLAVAVDTAGNVYVADTGNHRIRKIDASTGVIETVAGTGEYSYGGDGGPATEALLHSPAAVAVDAAGNVYLADAGNHRIRKVDASTGVIETVAGTGEYSYGGDGGPATEALLSVPAGVAVDGSGNVYLAEKTSFGIRIRRIDAVTGILTMVAATGDTDVVGPPLPPPPPGEKLPATVVSHVGLAVDSAGNAYVADRFDHRVSATRPAVLISVSLGSSSESVTLEVSEGGAITWLDGRSALEGERVTASNGNEYALGTGTDGRVMAAYVPKTQTVELAYGGSVVLGRDEDGTWRIDGEPVMHGDRHESGENEYILEALGGIWSLVATRDLLTIPVNEDGELVPPAGFELEHALSAGYLVGGGEGFAGDGGPAAEARLAVPHGVAVDATGNVYVADTHNHRVRRIDAATGVIETIAGMPGFVGLGDGGPAAEARLSQPEGVAVDATGNVYVADTHNHRVRRIDTATGVIQTIAGAGESGYGAGRYGGDGGPAAEALLAEPAAVAVDATGNVYVSDRRNHRVRRIDAATGVIETIAGSGSVSYNGDHGPIGDGGPATEAKLAFPAGVAVDAAGNVYVAGSYDHWVRKVDSATGVIETLAGTGEEGYEGDGGPATEALLADPESIAVDATGNVYVLDNKRVRRIDAATGVIETLAGTGEGLYPFTGSPLGLALDAAGNIYVADRLYDVVWALRPVLVLPIPADSSGTTIALQVSGDGLLRHGGRLVAEGTRVVRDALQYELTAGPDGGVLATYLPWEAGPEVSLLDREWMASADSAMVTVLLDGGGTAAAVDADARTPLHLAAWVNSDPAVAKALLDRRASVDDWDALGRYPLHYAALGGDNLAVAELLLERGADPLQVDNDVKTALDLAMDSGNTAVAELLAEWTEKLAVPDPYQVATWRLIYGDWARSATVASLTAVLDADPAALSTELRRTQGLLHRVASFNPDPAVARLLLDRGADDDFTVRNAAFFNPNPAVLELLLDQGADATEPFLLALALRNPNPAVAALVLARGADATAASAIASAAWNRNPAVVRMLLDRGADPNAVAYTQTPLYTAARYNPNAAVAELLLDQGAEVNATGPGGLTPLHGAMQNPNPAVARLLVNRGADIAAEDRQGRDPLSIHSPSGINPAAAQLLIDSGSQNRRGLWQVTDRYLQATSLSASWLANGSLAQVERWLDELGEGAVPLLNRSWIVFDRSGLHWAARNPNPAVAELLLDRGAELSVPPDGWTALHEAVRHNRNPAVAALLIERGADIPEIGTSSTALHLAARFNQNPAVAELLIERGAAIHAIASTGTSSTALHLAARFNRNPAVAELLLDRGSDLAALDDGGATPLLKAWLNGRSGVAAALLAKGAEPVSLAEERLLDADWLKDASVTQLEAQVINASDEDLQEKDECGRTALHLLAHYTARNGDFGDLTLTHFGRGWDLFYRRTSDSSLQELDGNGNTAFHYAVAGAVRVDEATLPWWNTPGESLFNRLVGRTLIDPAVVGGGSLQAAHYSSYQGSRDFNLDSRVATLIAERGWGDFTIDPMSGEPFPNRMVPQSRFDTCITSLP